DCDTAAGDDALERGMSREALDRSADLREPRIHRHDLLRQRARERRDRAGRAVLESLSDQRLGPDEDVETFEEVRRERLPGRIGHLHPDEVGHALAEVLDQRGRDGVPARTRELVDVERYWGAGVRGA